MANPARDTTAGRVYNDLRNLARRAGRSTDEIMVEYVLERFLYRLAASPLGREHFVLKGGLLLAQFGARRMTRSIDIRANLRPTHCETVRDRAGLCSAVVPDPVFPDQSTCRGPAVRTRVAPSTGVRAPLARSEQRT